MSVFLDERVPYRIETGRTLVRCWDPRGAMELQEAIDESVASLLPWMPWAKYEPRDYRSKIALLRRFRGDFDLGNDYVYGVFTRDESKVIGGCGLHTRAGSYALEVGYWVRSQFQNQGYATEITRSLMKVAFELSDIDNVQIMCAADNKRSLRVIEKVGFEIEGTLRHRQKDANGEFQDLVVGVFLRTRYDRSPIKRDPVRAFDAVDTLIL